MENMELPGEPTLLYFLRKKANTSIPTLRDPSWNLLGYDVSDSYLLSGLTNLSWGDGSTDEVQAISEKYLPSLNQYHLFTSVESAAQFIPLAEEGARAHAPFFVFGLWLIKDESPHTFSLVVRSDVRSAERHRRSRTGAHRQFQRR